MSVLLATPEDSIDLFPMNQKPHQRSGSVVLIIGKVWPEPGSSAAGSRMMQLIGLLMENDFRVVFATSAGESEYNALQGISSIETAEIALNDDSFDLFIRRLNPSVVIFDRFMTEEQFGWRVAEQCPDAVRILDTEDLHSLRHARKEALIAGVDFKPEMMFDHDITKREVAAICRSDLSFIISDVEMSLLLNHFPVEPEQLLYLPFMVEPLRAEDIKTIPGYADRNGFSTIGNFLHEPNRDSVRYLKKEIWPLIRKQIPDARMFVYGAYPAQQDMEMHAPDKGFHIKGRAEGAAEVIRQSKVLLAPLRFGAGMKGKLLDAMINGTPSVTTSIGIEGMAPANMWGGFVSDTAFEFADQAVRLYRDEPEWEKAQKTGFRVLQERFKYDKYSVKFIRRLLNLISGLKSHRANLFTSSMLMHHTLASHRYLSKWIQEKQKK